MTEPTTRPESHTEAEHRDWTAGPDGRSNTSPEFLALVAEVERLIRDDAHMLIGGHADRTAGLITAQLAHKHGLVPAVGKHYGACCTETELRQGGTIVHLAAENARLRQQRNKAERTVAQAVRVVHDLRALLDGERVPQEPPSEPKPQGCDDLCVRLSGVGLHPNVPGRVLCDCGAIITSAADVPVICACGKRHEPNPTEGDIRP